MRLLLVLLALGCAACADPEPVDQPRGNEAKRPDLLVDDLERRIHAAVNTARRREGLDAYGWRPVLSRAAKDHSCDMMERGFFEHITPDGSTPSDRAERKGVTCRTQGTDGRMYLGVSENLFRTSRYSGYEDWTQGANAWRVYTWQSADELALATVEGWLASPPHRLALLDPSSQEHGIGVCLGDIDVLVTQVMC